MPMVDEETGHIPGWEFLRRSFKPSGQILLLFVGESPPDPERGKFFYSGGPLAAVFQKGFRDVFPQLGNMPLHVFLRCFQMMGCYLDDISLKPVVRMDESLREAVLASEHDQFVQRLASYKPTKTVVFVKRTKPHIEKALVKARMDHEVCYLPFPLSSAKSLERFLSDLPPILQAALELPELALDQPFEVASVPEMDHDEFEQRGYDWSVIEGSDDNLFLEDAYEVGDQFNADADHQIYYSIMLEDLPRLAPHIKWRVSEDGSDDYGSQWKSIYVPRGQLIEAQTIFNHYILQESH